MKGFSGRWMAVLACAGPLIVAAPARAQLLSLDLNLLNDALIDLDVRIDTNEAVVVGLGTQVTNNVTAITNLGTTLDAAVQAAAALDARVGDVEAGVSANAGAIVALDVEVGAQGTAIGGLQQQVTGQGAAIGALDVRVTANTADLLALDTRVTSNTAAITATAGDLAGLTASINAGTIGLVQQQGGPSAPITVGSATGGTVVSFAGTAGDLRLTGVAAGVAATDAVNMAQLGQSSAQTLAAANSYTDSRMDAMMGQAASYTDAMIALNNRGLRREMDRIGASGAALSGLTQSIIPGQGMVTAGVGGRGEAMAVAVGVSKAFRSPHTPVLRAGVSFDPQSGGASYNAAVGFHF